jgi:spermidine/putrescine-binding protein
MRRRPFLKLASTFAATAVAAPYVHAQSKKFAGVTLRINGYGGTYDSALTANVANPLEEKYGLKVRFIAGSTDADLVKTVASRDNPPYDLFMGDSPHMAQLTEASMLEQISPSDVPNFARVFPNFREFGNYAAPFSVATVVPIYNSKLVKEPMTSYSDIARPDLKGRVVVARPGSTPAALMMLGIAHENGGSMTNMEPAYKVMANAKANIMAMPPTTVTQLQLFMDEEGTAGVFWDGRAHEMRTKGKPIVTVFPKTGVYGVTSYTAILKGCKYREAANAYIDQLLSDQGMLAIPNALRYGVTTDVKLSDELKSELLFNSPERVALKQPVDWSQLMKLRGEWGEKVNKILGG